jgi:hypothetical protein
MQINQWNIEKQYSKQAIRNHVLNELMETEDRQFNSELTKINKIVNDDKLFVDLLIVLLTNNRSSIQFIISTMIPHLEGEDVFDKADKAATLLFDIADECDLFDLIIRDDVIHIKSNYQLSENLQQYIVNTMYLPPMVCEPNPIKRNDDSAYLTTEDHVLSNPKRRHDYPINLKPLNISNNVALCLDERMILLKEYSKNPLDTPEKKLNFDRHTKATRQVIDLMLSNSNKFYMLHYYDHRGRLYQRAYHIGLMANTYRKAMIQLHQKYLIPLD